MTEALRRLDDAELFDWLRLARSDNVGPRTFATLLRKYGSARRAIAELPGLVRRGGSRPVELAAPAWMYYLLVYVSGLPPLEAAMGRSRGAAFQDYAARVSAFWPWPPRRQLSSRPRT